MTDIAQFGLETHHQDQEFYLTSSVSQQSSFSLNEPSRFESNQMEFLWSVKELIYAISYREPTAALVVSISLKAIA